jgi:hypothetical protein
MSIEEKPKEIKWGLLNSPDFENPTRRNAFLTILVILVASASFGLGRLSGLETVKKALEIDFPKGREAAVGAAFATTSAQLHIPQKTSGKYVASKNGAKYHLTACASAKNISEKNKIWFDTKQEAEVAGYAPASNCKGI